MAKYYVYTQVKSNVDPSLLAYDMQVHKTGGNGIKQYVLQTGIQPLPANYITKKHETSDISESQSAIFILEVMLYRKSGADYIPALSKPASSIYSLGEFSSDTAVNNNSRENIIYMETTQQTKKSKEGEIHTYNLTISRKERVFIAPEHPIGDPLDPFTQEKIDSQLSNRLNHLSYPDQNRTMLCGPAAFFYCLLKDRPDLYKQAVVDLSEIGKTKIGTLEINPSKGTKHPEGYFENGIEKISAIDWISLASLRDSENTILNYDSPADKISAITMWGVLESWFTKVGASKEFSNISIITSNVNDVCDLNEYVKNGNHIVCLISAGMLQLGADSPFKDHWIVWEGQVKLKKDNSLITLTTDLSEVIQLNLFSWGEVSNSLKVDLTLERFLKHTFGGMVFKKIP